MKVMIKDGLGANHHIRVGLANAFSMLGHEVFLWNSDQKSAFDAFSEVQPELIVCDTYTLDRAIVKCLLSRENIKVVAYAPNWGSSDDLVPKEFPILFAQDAEKEYVELLVKAGKLEYIFGQYLEEELAVTHDKWLATGAKVFSLIPALDTYEFPLLTPENAYRSDVHMTGGAWGYKNQSLQKYLGNLFYPNTKLNIKVFGNGWSAPQALGPISNHLMCKFAASAKICLNLFEPHSYDESLNGIFSDINQRTFNATAGFIYSQNANGLDKVMPHTITFDSLEQFQDELPFWLNDDSLNQRLHSIERNIDHTYKNHTFVHRVKVLFEKIGLVEESKQAGAFVEKQYENIQPVKDNHINTLREFFRK